MALDTQLNNITEWSRLNTQGPFPGKRSDWRAVSDNTGIVYLYGGCYVSSYVNCTIDATAMFIFDTVKYSWTTKIQSNPPAFQAYYSATMLPDGRIIYIGGAYVLISTGYNAMSINPVRH